MKIKLSAILLCISMLVSVLVSCNDIANIDVGKDGEEVMASEQLGDTEASESQSSYTESEVEDNENNDKNDGELETDAPHTHEWVYEDEKAPTCTEQGWEAYRYCPECEESTLKYIAATGHVRLREAVQENLNAATCTEDGGYDSVVYCECGTEVSRTPCTVPATGHVRLREAVQENANAATCTEDGGYDSVVYCECGTEVSRTPCTVPATGHVKLCEAVQENATAASCTEDGSYDSVVYCECGAEVGRTPCTVPATGHTPVTDAAVESTCTESGLTEGSHCGVCDTTLVAQTVVEKKAHNYVNGVCSGCEAGLAFTLCGEEYTVSGIGSYTRTDVIIPDTYKGLPVTSIADDAFKENAKITSVTIPSTVTSIGSSAFLSCTRLTRITLSEGVTSIGNSAFGCTGITEIKLPDSVTSIGTYAFAMCEGLTSITISKGMKSIGEFAFYDCPVLEYVYFNATSMDDLIPDNWVFRASGRNGNGISVIFGANVTRIPARLFLDQQFVTGVRIEKNSVCVNIGFWAFQGCTGVKEIYFGATEMNDTAAFEGVGNERDGVSVVFGANVKIIPASLFKGNNNITSVEFEQGSGCISVGDSAFYGCSRITKIHLPDGVTSIGAYAFYECSALATANIPDGVTVIEAYTFYGCSSLDKIRLPDGVTIVGAYAFCGCASLTSVNLPAGMTYVDAYTFQGCTSLLGINIHENIASIGEYAFFGCTSISEVNIHGKMALIGLYAFGDCASLERVRLDVITENISDLSSAFKGIFGNSGQTEKGITLVFGSDITGIPENFFYGVTGITSVIIPDSVRTIGEYAFYGCSRLTSITIGKGVTSISYAAFSNCAALEKIYFNATSMNSLSQYTDCVFSDVGQNGDGISIVIGANVTRIPAYLFYEQKCVTSVIFEAGSVCTSIAGYAFFGCTGITEIKLPDSLTQINVGAFSGCTELTGIVIPDAVSTIYDATFENCTGLTGITLGSCVTDIGKGAFKNCTSLEEIRFNAACMNDLSTNNEIFCNAGRDKGGIKVTVGAKATKIPAYLFSSYAEHETSAPKIAIIEFEANSVCESIGDYAFYGCTSLSEIAIPDSVTYIGSYTFYNCSGLTEVKIPESITDIGDYLFYGCTGLTEATIHEKVTNIGKYSFYGCTGISAIIIPDSVHSIDSCAFGACTALKSLTVGEGVTSISNNSFAGCEAVEVIYFNAAAFEGGWGIYPFSDVGEKSEELKIVIGTDIAAIPEYLFFAQPYITSVAFEEGSECTDIGGWAFQDCTGLVSISLPDSTVNIGDYAFYGCTSLSEITIPADVTSIGRCAFRECTALTNALFENKNGWIHSGYEDGRNPIEVSSTELSDTETAASYFKDTPYYWFRIS